jgi:hypothetical protein
MNMMVSVASFTSATAILPEAAAGLVPGEPDPIFAAIERHRQAFAKWEAAIEAQSALVEEESRKRHCDASGDKPLVAAEQAAREAHAEAMGALIQIAGLSLNETIEVNPPDPSNLCEVQRRYQQTKKIWLETRTALERAKGDYPTKARNEAAIAEAKALCETTNDAMEGAAFDLLNIVPTTLAGVIALLRYAIEYELLCDWPSDVGASDDEDPRLDGRSWSVWSWYHVANTLERLGAAA